MANKPIATWRVDQKLGLGISFLSYHTVAREIEQGHLAILRVEGTPVMRKWYVVRNKKKYLLPSAVSLWDFIYENGAEYLPAMKPRKN